MATIPNQPTLIAEAPREEARAQRLARLQDAIANQPGVFLQTYAELGDEATATSLDLYDPRIQTVGISVEPRDLIIEFFSKRDDKVVVYDDSTEDALFGDKRYKELITTSRNLPPDKIMTGVMSSVTKENPKAKEARDKARRFAFGFFLKRAVAWSTQEDDKVA